jgi:hypothetical protein
MKNQILKVVFLIFIMMIDFSYEKVTTTVWISYSSTNGVSVQAIAIDATDSKWFCTYGDGIIKFNDTNWIKYTNNGLISGSCVVVVGVAGLYILNILLYINIYIWLIKLVFYK